MPRSTQERTCCASVLPQGSIHTRTEETCTKNRISNLEDRPGGRPPASAECRAALDYDASAEKPRKYSIARTNSPEIADQYIHEIKGMGIEIVDIDLSEIGKAKSKLPATDNIR